MVPGSEGRILGKHSCEVGDLSVSGPRKQKETKEMLFTVHRVKDREGKDEVFWPD